MTCHTERCFSVLNVAKDCRKADCNCVEGGIVVKMRHYGMEEKFVKLCEGLYCGVERRVVITKQEV